MARVSGLAALQRAFQTLQRELQKRDVGDAPARRVLRRAARIAPKDTGRLASSGSVRPLLGLSVLEFEARYIIPQHFGWRTPEGRFIEGRPFIFDAIEAEGVEIDKHAGRTADAALRKAKFK